MKSSASEPGLRNALRVDRFSDGSHGWLPWLAWLAWPACMTRMARMARWLALYPIEAYYNMFLFFVSCPRLDATDGKSFAGIMTAAVSSVLSEVQGNNLADNLAHMRPLVPNRCTCVVIALSRNSRSTSFIYALQLVNDGCIKGQPFPLHQSKGKVFWPNRTITREKISFGTVLRCQAIGDIFTYQSNTAKRMVGFIHDDVAANSSLVNSTTVDLYPVFSRFVIRFFLITLKIYYNFI